MNIQDTKSMLKILVEHKAKVTPFLWAQHGVGKSSIVHQLGAELGYKTVSLILSQREAVDLTGMLYAYEDSNLGMQVTSSNPPVWFAEALVKGKMILFLDELNMARREVQNAAFELILDRRLNNQTLPDDVFIVCAGNPDDERYDVVPMSESLKDRLMHIKVTADVPTWLKYANDPASKIHPDVAKYIGMNPKAAFAADKRDEKFPVEIKHSFRSWERVGLIHSLPLAANLKTECIRGIVGPELAISFMQTVGSAEIPLTAAEILSPTASTVARMDRWINGTNGSPMRIDLLTLSIEALVTKVKESKCACSDSIKAFIKRLPDDVAHLAISQLFEFAGYSDAFVGDPELQEKINQISDATALKETA